MANPGGRHKPPSWRCVQFVNKNQMIYVSCCSVYITALNTHGVRRLSQNGDVPPRCRHDPAALRFTSAVCFFPLSRLSVSAGRLTAAVRLRHAGQKSPSQTQTSVVQGGARSLVLKRLKPDSGLVHEPCMNVVLRNQGSGNLTNLTQAS